MVKAPHEGTAEVKTAMQNQYIWLMHTHKQMEEFKQCLQYPGNTFRSH